MQEEHYFDENDKYLDDEYHFDKWFKEQEEIAEFERIYSLTGTYPF